MAYVYQIVVLDPRTTLLIKCRAIYMATLTGSRNMHHWTFTLNLNFATGMWKQTFHDDLECHKLMFEKISVQHVLSTHALMSKGPDQGRLKKGLGFSKWRVCLKNCSFWEVCVDQFYFEQCHDWAYRDYFRSCAQRSLHHCKKREAHLWQVWPVLVSSEV